MPGRAQMFVISRTILPVSCFYAFAHVVTIYLKKSFYLFIYFWQYWGFNSGPHGCYSSTLSLELIP
jgi:hypothetical protein